MEASEVKRVACPVCKGTREVHVYYNGEMTKEPCSECRGVGTIIDPETAPSVPSYERTLRVWLRLEGPQIDVAECVRVQLEGQTIASGIRADSDGEQVFSDTVVREVVITDEPGGL
jgi:hypothetical protein